MPFAIVMSPSCALSFLYSNFILIGAFNLTEAIIAGSTKLHDCPTAWIYHCYATNLGRRQHEKHQPERRDAAGLFRASKNDAAGLRRRRQETPSNLPCRGARGAWFHHQR